MNKSIESVKINAIAKIQNPSILVTLFAIYIPSHVGQNPLYSSGPLDQREEGHSICQSVTFLAPTGAQGEGMYVCLCVRVIFFN